MYADPIDEAVPREQQIIAQALANRKKPTIVFREEGNQCGDAQPFPVVYARTVTCCSKRMA